MLSNAGLSFVLKYEGFAGAPYVPSDKSGVTLDYGYDLQFHTADQLRSDWAPYIGIDAVRRLSGACAKPGQRGLSGDAARKVAAACSDIRITIPAASGVFHVASLPLYWNELKTAFPGVEKLPQGAQDGLFSLVFNRGGDMTGDRRLEMREIRDEIAKDAPNVHWIASLVRNMQRLWVGPPTDDDGLLERRLAEADLIDKSAP